jgi:TolA-binding protein
LGAALPRTRLALLALLPFLLASVSGYGRSGAGQFRGRRAWGILVAGTLTSSKGSALSSVRVQLETAMGDFVQSTYTDSSGSFTFSGVKPGSYVIVVSARGYHAGSWPIQVNGANMVGLTFSLVPSTDDSPLAKSAPKGSKTVSVHELLVPQKARKEYEKAVKSVAHGKTDEAIRHWKKSIEIYPQYAKSYMELSRVYAERGDFSEATKAARRAVALDGRSADPYVYLGYVYLKQKDYPKAQGAFATAVGISDSDWFSQFWLGALLLREHKDAKGAYPHLLRASRLNPKSQEVSIALYNDLLALGRGQEALAELDSFLKRFPKSPLAPKVREKRKSLKKSLAAEEH